MSMTRGGPNRAKRFDWQYDAAAQNVVIRNENDRVLVYTVDELANLLGALEATFGITEFPLANNVEKLGAGTERPGLGMTLLSIKPKDIVYAQGSSYLGVVLEELGYLRWNGRSRGIAWRLTGEDGSQIEVGSRLEKREQVARNTV